MSNTIADLRKHLFDAIAAVKDGKMDTEQAKTISELSQVVINSAKVEVDFMKMRGGDGLKGTGFIPEEKQIAAPGTPAAPRLVKGRDTRDE